MLRTGRESRVERKVESRESSVEGQNNGVSQLAPLLAPHSQPSPPRRGVLLLVVLSMLVLFMLIGTAFLMTQQPVARRGQGAGQDRPARQPRHEAARPRAAAGAARHGKPALGRPLPQPAPRPLRHRRLSGRRLQSSRADLRPDRPLASATRYAGAAFRHAASWVRRRASSSISTCEHLAGICDNIARRSADTVAKQRIELHAAIVARPAARAQARSQCARPAAAARAAADQGLLQRLPADDHQRPGERANRRGFVDYEYRRRYSTPTLPPARVRFPRACSASA